MLKERSPGEIITEVIEQKIMRLAAMAVSPFEIFAKKGAKIAPGKKIRHRSPTEINRFVLKKCIRTIKIRGIIKKFAMAHLNKRIYCLNDFVMSAKVVVNPI